MPPPGYQGSGLYYNLQQFHDLNQDAVPGMQNTVNANQQGAYDNAVNSVQQVENWHPAPGVNATYGNTPSNQAPDTTELGNLYQSALASLSGAEGQQNLGNTFAGRQTLLQNAYGNSGSSPYTQGMSRLDAWLLPNQAPKQDFAALRQRLSDAGDKQKAAVAGVTVAPYVAPYREPVDPNSLAKPNPPSAVPSAGIYTGPPDARTMQPLPAPTPGVYTGPKVYVPPAQNPTPGIFKKRI